MNMLPLGKRVIVKPLPRPDTTESGLRLIENDPSPDTAGVVVAVSIASDGEVSVGDTVLFPDFAGQLIALSRDEKYIVLDLDELLAVGTEPLTECPLCGQPLEAQ